MQLYVLHFLIYLYLRACWLIQWVYQEMEDMEDPTLPSAKILSSKCSK